MGNRDTGPTACCRHIIAEHGQLRATCGPSGGGADVGHGLLALTGAEIGRGEQDGLERVSVVADDVDDVEARSDEAGKCGAEIGCRAEGDSAELLGLGEVEGLDDLDVHVQPGDAVDKIQVGRGRLTTTTTTTTTTVVPRVGAGCTSQAEGEAGSQGRHPYQGQNTMSYRVPPLSKADCRPDTDRHRVPNRSGGPHG